MESTIKEHMYRIVDAYIDSEDLNGLLKSFVDDKAEETSVWSQITILTHRMLGGDDAAIERLAAAAELMILSLDMMDDLQDQDQPGKPWMQCPRAYVLNAILAMQMGFIGELGKQQLPPTAFSEASRIVARAVNGQQKDLNHSVTSPEAYLSMVQEKSGSIFRLACCIGYAPLAVDEETTSRLLDLADCIGLIHQIQNDCRDVLRFDVKNDLLGKKRTLPLLYLLTIEDVDFAPIQDYYKGNVSTDFILGNKHEIIQLIQESGCLEYARVIQSICLQQAEELFGSLPLSSPWKEQFKSLTFGSFVS
ncbi:polyprenyl synthetase family protein [Paenibacillus sp. CF384]|uniref:polyprenyl synthetase family protein n=1 Tax=Paenibacillus sp. CF384 TaxID=1884382 RepID=UPI00089BABE0|nr:polyprenyl synthetase family protein [Paenibacillus sp. CF384]SDW68589.1 competence protein ComQ [Paenibacillus sp. CF384]